MEATFEYSHKLSVSKLFQLFIKSDNDNEKDTF